MSAFANAILPTPTPVFQYMNYVECPNQFQKVLITSAQLLALHTTAIVVAPAGGANTLLVPRTVSARYIFATTPYTIGASAVVKLYLGSVSAGHALTASFATGLVDQSANTIVPFVALATPSTFDTDANYLNKALSIGNDNATQLTAGDGSLEVMISYNTYAV